MKDKEETTPPRRAEAIREIVDSTGITEDMIAELVREFYARVRSDSLLGPIFEAKVEDWDAHLDRLRAFWSSVVLTSGRYHGLPAQAHFRLPIDGLHFDRWLALFEETANDVCPPAAAAHFVAKARRIADSFEMGMATQRGEIKAPTREMRPTETSGS